MRLIWLTICVVLLISGCANSARVAPFEFTHLSHSLAGDIYYPAGNGPYPGVLIVHGDGPIQRDAAGYYQPFVEILNRAGYAVASWDKPGVGDSTGNWLNQSMSQRSDELQQAIAHLRKMPDINDNQIGLLGFSQAGWVMPKALLADDRLSFMIAISPAINWQQQARYLTQSRMLSEGYSEQEVQVAQEFNKKEDVLLQRNASYDEYLELMKIAPPCCNDAMSEDRWQFVLLNFSSDASLEWARLKQPFIAVFGDNDLNIDVENSIDLISKVVNSKRGCGAAVITIKNADHSLFPAKKPRITKLDSALIGRLVMVGLIGEKAFAKDSLSAISQWLDNRKQHPTKCY